MNGGLPGEVYRNLLRLTSENVSDGMLTDILKNRLGLPHDDIFKLSFDQAERLHEVLSPLPNLYNMLFSVAEPIVGAEQADKVARAQLDMFAIEFVDKANWSLFKKPRG